MGCQHSSTAEAKADDELPPRSILRRKSTAKSAVSATTSLTPWVKQHRSEETARMSARASTPESGRVHTLGSQALSRAGSKFGNVVKHKSLNYFGSTRSMVRMTKTGTMKRDQSVRTQHEEHPASEIPDVARRLLQVATASGAQTRFLEAWLDAVFKPGLPHVGPGNAVLMVSSDISFLEVSITEKAGLLFQLVRTFAMAWEVPSMAALEALERVQELLKASEVTAWCRLKNMGEADPGFDAGICINRELGWLVADLLMPWVDAQDALREHSAKQKYRPIMYSSSVFPSESERSLSFEMMGEETLGRIQAGLRFFHSLGHEPPREDEALQHLVRSQPARCRIHAAMDCKGLARLSMQLQRPRCSIAQELAEVLSIHYKSWELDNLEAELGVDVNLVEYVAEARGYSVAVGFAI